MTYSFTPSGASGERVSPKLHQRVARAVTDNPTRAVASTLMSMIGTAVSTPENFALLTRYVARFKIEFSPSDIAQGICDAQRWAEELSALIGRAPSRFEVAESMLTALREVEPTVFAGEGAK